MLVLSRKKNEEIVIGGQIVVTVVNVSGGRVRLGISAPDEISVHRAEVDLRIRRETHWPAEEPSGRCPNLVDAR